MTSYKTLLLDDLKFYHIAVPSYSEHERLTASFRLWKNKDIKVKSEYPHIVKRVISELQDYNSVELSFEYRTNPLYIYKISFNDLHIEGILDLEWYYHKHDTLRMDDSRILEFQSLALCEKSSDGIALEGLKSIKFMTNKTPRDKFVPIKIDLEEEEPTSKLGFDI